MEAVVESKRASDMRLPRAQTVCQFITGRWCILSLALSFYIIRFLFYPMIHIVPVYLPVHRYRYSRHYSTHRRRIV